MYKLTMRGRIIDKGIVATVCLNWKSRLKKDIKAVEVWLYNMHEHCLSQIPENVHVH